MPRRNLLMDIKLYMCLYILTYELCTFICITYEPSNYGLSTDPKTEYDLVMSGGIGLEKKMVTMPDGMQVVRMYVYMSAECKWCQRVCMYVLYESTYIDMYMFI